eukprot:1152000-Pelagomonas_calceolata.AAC.3
MERRIFVYRRQSVLLTASIPQFEGCVTGPFLYIGASLAAFQDEGMRAVVSMGMKSCKMYGASTLQLSRPLP